MSGAEEIPIRKLYKDKVLRDFNRKDLNNFLGSDNEQTFLSQSEKLKIIEHALNSLRIGEDNFKLNGKYALHNYDGLSKYCEILGF
mgnify:CR=1 FL=1